MVWQDLVFMAGSLLTIVFLAPAVRNANARIPLATSLPKMALGVVYAVTFLTLEMYLAAVGLLGTGVMWCLIGAYRSPQGRSLLSARARTGRSASIADDNSSIVGNGSDRTTRLDD